jgi:hypothetical protein
LNLIKAKMAVLRSKNSTSSASVVSTVRKSQIQILPIQAIVSCLTLKSINNKNRL